jgi:hypothetical protein
MSDRSEARSAARGHEFDGRGKRCLRCGDSRWAHEHEAPVDPDWTPLQFYAYIVRNLGLPARFHFDGKEWVGEAPFTRPVPQSILDLLEAQGV